MITAVHPYTLTLADCHDAALVGGKGVNLGKLIRAGFPVPGGFVVTTRAFDIARAGNFAQHMPEEIAADILHAYREMGRGTVAVRSSATAEDMQGASMAGQYETFLNIDSEETLLNSVQRCWASVDSPRTRAYLAEHGIDLSQVSMAVVVQRLVAADVAGVLFTQSPDEQHNGDMVLEASWGLGESVVSGRVQPDVLRLERDTERVVNASIADKRVYLPPGAHEEMPVEEARRKLPCLNGRDVYRLWQLGRRAADYFGSPQDIEWAIEAGEVFMVQSRPITTRHDAEAIEQSLRTTRQHLREELNRSRGPWVVHNLAETLPHPTPLTWSVIKRFMSGANGFGTMYRAAGFEPSPLADREGFLDCIGGRIYMDVSRAGEMFFENFPFAYDIEELKRNPDASQQPPTLVRGSFRQRLSAAKKLGNVAEKLREISTDLDQTLRESLFEEVNAYVARSRPIDLRTLSTDWLVELWRQHEKMVLDTFAPQLMLPSLISGMALSDLTNLLAENFWDEDPQALARDISAGGPPNRTVIADAELYELGKGERTLESWLTAHGHRAPGEFDLASRRWREQPTAVREMAARLAKGESPLERNQRNSERIFGRVEALRARLSHHDCANFDRLVSLVRRYMPFREDAKDVLMLGYQLLRDVALEAGRRLEIGEDVFYLTREDLFDALRVGFAPHHLIAQRKTTYRAEAKLTLPRVIDAAAIDTLGRAATPQVDGVGHVALSISSGEARGPARILHEPTTDADLGQGYILICPSTDPSWTPLFAGAAGLVLECGGSLSHGAVVAREMGLPAVVLPDATRLFKNGDDIIVDGRRGSVRLASDETPATTSEPLSDDPHIARVLMPPPPGQKDRFASRLATRMALLWSILIVGFFFAPAHWFRQPVMNLLDALLWPIVRSFGKPAVVVTVSFAIAIASLLIQRFLTDNKRLLQAKRRAADLREQANLLPQKSVRRQSLLQLAAPVPARLFAASLVPIGILLGPMVMPFVWFHERIDPTAWNAPAGSSVQIVASIDGDSIEPVELHTPASFNLDESTPATRSLPPLRATLEHLLSLYRQPRHASDEPIELQIAPDPSRDMVIDDLQQYLNAGIPAQSISWSIHAPAGWTGRIPVTVSDSKNRSTTINIVLGESSPPSPMTISGSSDSTIRQLRAVYSQSKQERFFFRPLSWMNGTNNALAGKLAAVDIGWVWLYILAYLPAILLFRWLLKIP